MCAWPNLGSAAFACTIGMIERTPRHTSTIKCVCAVMLTEKEGVLTQVRARRVSQERASAESFAAGARLISQHVPSRTRAQYLLCVSHAASMALASGPHCPALGAPGGQLRYCRGSRFPYIGFPRSRRHPRGQEPLTLNDPSESAPRMGPTALIFRFKASRSRIRPPPSCPRRQTEPVR
jgi:hypothetical protein